MPLSAREKDFYDPAELLETALRQTWQALCQSFDVITATPNMECLFQGVDLSSSDAAAREILINMLMEVMENVSRYSPWYRKPACAYGILSIHDQDSGRSHRILAPEAEEKWKLQLVNITTAIQMNSGLIQAMLLVDSLMMQASLEDPCVFANCACSPARTVRLRQSILGKGEILCESCGRPFEMVEDFQRLVLEDIKREQRSSMMMFIKQPLTVRQLIEAKYGSFARPLSVSIDTSVFDALRLMAEKNLGAVTVIDRTGEMVGIFTERDYARKVILMGRSSPETRVSEIMSQATITVSPYNTLEECLSLMTQNYIRHLPVIEAGRLISIISMRDIMTALINKKDTAIETLEKYILGDDQ